MEVQLEALEGRLDLSSVLVRVLPEPLLLAVPPEARAGMAWHLPRLYDSYDPWQLAKRARKLFHSIAPQARQFEGNPLELSYFLLSNLPVDDDVRQQLLEVATVDERLRRECRLLQALGTLCCRACGATLARSTDAVQVGGRWVVLWLEARKLAARCSCQGLLLAACGTRGAIELVIADVRGRNLGLLRQQPLGRARHSHPLPGKSSCCCCCCLHGCYSATVASTAASTAAATAAATAHVVLCCCPNLACWTLIADWHPVHCGPALSA